MKRIVAFLLSLCLVISLVPVSMLTALEVSAEPAASDHTDHTGWTKWDGTTAPADGGKYYLDATLNASTYFTIPKGATVTVCLNGNSVNAATNSRLFRMAADTKLTICDCGAEYDTDGNRLSTNKIVPNKAKGGFVLMSPLSGESPTKNSVLILENIVVDGTGITNPNGGAIHTDNKMSEISMTKCEMRNCVTSAANSAGAISMNSGGKLTATDCLFSGNKSTASSGRGGAINLPTQGGGVTLTNCQFLNNETAGEGGAIRHSTSALTMTNCTFTGNRSTKAGGAICLTGGSMSATGCTFTGNTAGTNGSAIYTKTNTALTSCSITGNTATGIGALYGEPTDSRVVSVAGTTKITGNTAAAAQNADVYVAEGKKLTVDGLSTDANINVATPNNAEASAFMAAGSNQTAGTLPVFYQNTGKQVVYSNNVFSLVEIVHKGHHVCACVINNDPNCQHSTQTQWEIWDRTDTLPVQTGNYYLTEDITLTNTAAMEIKNNQEVVLCLNGHSVQFNADYTGINYSVEAGSKLTVMNCKAALDSKGLFVTPMNPDNTRTNAGALYGGKGGVIQTAGEVNLIGVELYDNGTSNSGNGGAVKLTGGTLNARHTKFDSNKAKNGGVFHVTSGSPAITLDDAVVSNNVAGNTSSGSGGVIDMRVYTATTQDVVLTIKGDSQITGNRSGGSGSVIYAAQATDAANTAACKVVLQENVVITGNTVAGTSKKGTVAMDIATGAKKVGILSVSGNVQIKDNAATNTAADVAKNVYLHSAKVKLEVGAMGAQADIGVRYTSATTATSDPDNFINKAADAQIADDSDTGIRYENVDPAKEVYYNSTDGFYFYTAPAPVVHTHHACTCVLENGHACAGHGSDAELNWTAWTDATTLPTATGNYFLTGNITLTNTAAMEIAAGQDVKLCLNGHSVQFNSANTAAANYLVAADAKLTVMNCQAKLDNKGLFVSGNKADATDLTAGRLYGGRGNKGGALLVAGEANLIGVELYDNGVAGKETGGAVRMTGGKLYAVHAKFDSNKAVAGAAIGNNTSNVTITLDDTILSNNEAKSSSSGNGGAIYLKSFAAGTQDSVLTVKGDSQITGNKSYSSGSAIYASTENKTTATTACRVVLQDNVVISGNEATRTSGAAKGAVSMDTGKDSGKESVLAVSGNVQVRDNTVNSTDTANAKNVGLTNVKAKLEVGEMGADADVRVSTASVYADPDSFMNKAANANIPEDTAIGITYEKTDPAKAVYYSSIDGFYFYDPTLPPPPTTPHVHHACVCAITGDTACQHSSETQWTPWMRTDLLPTAEGNYYLVADVQLSGGIEISKNVKLCLNGFSVKLDENYTDGAAINVKEGGSLTVMNCQAVLDENNLLVSGNKADENDLTAGRLSGGRGKYGGAIYVGGTANLIGVELYDNRSGNNYGGAVYVTGGQLNTYSVKFADNFAKYGGAIANTSGDLTINLHDTVITNKEENTASAGGAIYFKACKDGTTTQDIVLTISGNSKIYGNYATGSGAAIYVTRDADAPEGVSAHVVLKDNVVITDNHGGSAKGAIAMDVTGGEIAYLDISGNVQIFGNESPKGNGNVYLNAKDQIRVGQLGSKAKVYVTTSAAQADPDGFLKLAEGVNLTDTAKTGFIYENMSPFVPVGYKNDKNVQFYFAVEGETHKHQACACVISGDTSCKHTGETEWTPWLYADKLPTTSGNYYLTKDIKLTGTSGGSIGMFEIKDGQSVNLCLNGFSIACSEENTNKTSYYAMIGSQLTIMNCKAELTKDGKLVNDDKTGGQITGGRGRYGGAMYFKGDVTVIGVAFRDNQATHKTEGMGGALRVQDGGKLTVQYCLFENNKATTNGGAICTGRGEAELTIADCVFRNNSAATSGGTITMNSASSKLTITDSLITDSKAQSAGGAIYAKACEMVLSGVSVTNNEANSSGGIYVQGKSTCTITDSVIEGNTGATNAGGLYAKTSKVTLGKGTVIRGNTAASGGGVILQNMAELTFAGGVIENNKARSGGGMTLWDRSIVYLKDGKIANNEATHGAGGGIYMQSGSDLVINGGSITGNKSKTYGGAVYANMNDKVKTIDITVSGGEVSGNKTEGTGGGIYALSAKMVISGGKITGNEAAKSGGGVYLGSSAAAGSVLGAMTMTGGEISANKADSGGGIFQSTNTDGEYTGGMVTKNVATTYAGGIYLKKSRVVFDKDFLVSENESKTGGGILLQNETQLNMKGGKVEKNIATSGGGGILWSKSVLTLSGGQIVNNKSNGSGGGLYMQSGSFLYVNSGKITRNTATKGGGGVFCNGNNADRLTVKMTGGEISYNNAGTAGGGLSLGGAKAGTAMVLSGGSVKNNTTTEQQGGGIYIAANCSLTMWGGSVSGNYSKATGGGIYMFKGTLMINGGAVSYNKCDASGGGVHTSGGKMELNGGTISNNFAGAYGGGIRTYNNTEFTMTGGNICYNEAENRGGGVALWSSMTMTGGSVSYNAVIGDPDGKDTNTYGGGIAICDNNSVYVKDHYTLDITDGEFIGNTCINKGGALSVTGECYIYVKDSVFKENEAQLGGAIIADNHKNNRSVPSELYVTNCQFTGNKATNGGAIYGNWASETTVEGSTFTDNTAAEAGGAIHLRGQSMGWINTSVFTKNTAGQKGAAIYCADDAEFDSLTITGNNSGDGYAFYIEEGAFDGLSVVKAIVKISGDMKVYDNEGSKPDMFIAKDAMVHVNYAGLGKDAKIHVQLAQGVLTNTLIGAYNYEGGNLDYTVTYGDRSLTDPEPIPVVEPEVEDTTPATDPTATGDTGKTGSFGVGGVIAISAVLVVGVIAVLAAVAVKKKKKAEEPAKDAVQE